MNRPLELLALAGFALAVGCGGADQTNDRSTDATEAAVQTPTVLEQAVEMPDGSQVAGAPLADEVETVTLADALAEPASYAGRTVRMTAAIDQVCQASGCWMIVSDGDAESRITFRDYGFFVPKDAAGRRVEMDVTVQRETMSVEDARHLASETEGQDPEAITEPVETVSVVATGVRILPAGRDGSS